MQIPETLNVVERYSPTAQALHWLTALLVFAAFILSVGGPETRVYSPSNDFDRGLHELLGMSVFGLTLVRLCWRAVIPPPNGPVMPFWMELGAKFGHWVIYALLVLVPLTAVLGAWLSGHPLTVLAVGNIQPWLSQSRQLGVELASIHGWLGDALIWIAGLHATIALYHHFWRHDNVLLSMLPGRRKSGSA
jgi:cytochrome b561